MQGRGQGERQDRIIKIYNLAYYGITEGAILNTAAIQRVIDECSENGGGEVVIPAGIYRVAGLRQPRLVLCLSPRLHYLQGLYCDGQRANLHLGRQ